MSSSNRLTMFDLERKRDSFAKKRDFMSFKKTYLTRSVFINDLNSSVFWDRKILGETDSLCSSSIYLDKNNKIFEFLSGIQGNFLDIGFGYGELEKKLKNMNRLNVYGIDVSPLAVRNAKKKLKGEYKIGSILSIPYNNNFFDVIVVSDVLEHISFTKIFKVFSEIRKRLRASGSFIVSVPLNEHLEELIINGENPNGHMRAYTPDILRTELRLAGFEINKEIFLYAFSESYKLKSLLMKVLPNFRQSNLMIVLASKK